MANPFYNATGNPGTGSEGLSALMRAEFTAIQAGFDTLPRITTTGLFATVLNQVGNITYTLPSQPGTLALSADVAAETTRATAAEALLAPKASPHLTGSTTIDSATISGGTINGAAIGALSAQPGAFTSLYSTTLRSSQSVAVAGQASGTWATMLSGAPTNQNNSDILVGPNAIAHRLVNDANTTAVEYISIARSGLTAATVTLTATAITLAGGSVTSGPLTISDPSGSDTAALTISAPGDTNGVNIRLIGNGSNPDKTIHVSNGSFQIINSGYVAPILTLDNGGALSIGGTFTAAAGINGSPIGASAAATGRFTTLSAAGITSTGNTITISGTPNATWASRLSGAPTDQNNSDVLVGSGGASFRLLNDAATSANEWMGVTRSGYSAQAITFTALTIALNASQSVTVPTPAAGDNSTKAASTAFVATAAAALQPALGFTPVQQGGGTGQTNDKVYIGYSAAGVKVQVNGADFGSVITTALPHGFVQTGDNASLASVTTTGNVAANVIYPSAVNCSNGFLLYGDSGGRSIQWTSDGWKFAFTTGVGQLNYYSNAGTSLLQVTNGGNLTIPGNVSAANVSDENAKRNIAPYRSGLAGIIGLEPITYEYNGLGGTTDDGKTRWGVSAQQARTHLPECVYETPEPPSDPGHPNPVKIRFAGQLSFDEQPLLYAMINAFREVAAELASCKERLAALETPGQRAVIH